MTSLPLAGSCLRLHPDDDVALARTALAAGTLLSDGTVTLALADDVPAGHKLAVRPVRVGDPVRKYGQVIGLASSAIAAGEHVHAHNLAFADVDRGSEIGVEARPTEYVP